MNNSKTSLFLMELIIVILFFSLASAVCIQLFFMAHNTDIDTRNKTNAAQIVQNMSEVYYSVDGNLENYSQIYENSSFSDNKIIIYFDSDWNIIPGKDIASFTEEVSYVSILENKTNEESDEQDNGALLCADIYVYTVGDTNNPLTFQDSDVILSQTLEKYNQFKWGAN